MDLSTMEKPKPFGRKE